MRNFYLQRVLISLLLLGFLPSAMASVPAHETSAFLRQIPSSNLQDFAGSLQGRAADPAKPFALLIPEGKVQGEEFAGDQYAYRVASSAPSGSAAASVARSGSSTALHHGWGGAGRGFGLRRFAIFAHCVVRSFYLVRFEANNDPDDPLDPGIPDDPLCPDRPEHYLKQAERFADHFFHLS